MQYQFDPLIVMQPGITIRLPEQLRSLRGCNAVRQKDVAAALHIDRSTYAYYETGATQPSLSILVKLALLYDVTTDFLLGYQWEKKL